MRRFSTDEYHRLIEEGFFARDERFELLEGWIVAKMSRNPPHDACLARMRRLIDQNLPPGWHVRVQSAVTTADSEPEPDLAVVAGDEFTYVARHPGAGDTALMIEVANRSLAEDRGAKLRIYSRAGFAHYWILNLIDGVLGIYADPTGPSASPGYRVHAVCPAAGLAPFKGPLVAMPALQIREVLP